MTSNRVIERRIPWRRNREALRRRVSGTLLGLQSKCQSNKFTGIEYERFARDLQLTMNRLESREYRQTSFRPRNMLTIPDRTEEIFQDILFFWSVGKIWCEIFNKLKISNKSSVLDFCPGYFPKVELGLYYAGFKGAVTMIEQDRIALKYSNKFLLFFDSKFEVRYCHGSLWSQQRNSGYDLIVANHAIDDLLLAEFCNLSEIPLSVAYQEERLYSECWSSIVSNPSWIKTFVVSLSKKLNYLVSSNGKIVLLDYPGFSHRSLKQRRLVNCVRKCQRLLKVELDAMGYRETKIFRGQTRKIDRLVIRPTNLLVMSRV